MINTITINSATCSAVLSPLWQYDYGQYLKIEGIDLPQSFEVDFATIDQSSSVTMLGEDGQVKVPDDMLDEGVDITAYIYLHSDETDGYTEYVIQIPVISRPDRTEETPTPQEQTLIEQAITVLNHAVEQTGQDVQTAQQAAEDAEAAAQTATEASETATDAATSASASATAAATSASAAEISATQAGLSANSAAASATSAAQSASDAQSAVASIGDSVTRAEAAAATAQSAATTATTKASEANTSAGVAASNATTATVKAQEAAQSATQAAQSATAAQTAQTGAEAAQTGAETAQTAAESAAASAEEQADRAEGYANRLTDFLPVDTASGSIASFSDGADGVEIKSAVVQIVPKQAGSGDPSPENVRPITGWTGANVTDDPAYGGTIEWNQLNDNGGRTGTTYGVTATKNTTTGEWDFSGTASQRITWIVGTEFSLCGGHVYFVKGCPNGGSTQTYSFGIGGLQLEFGNGRIWKNTNNYTRGNASYIIESGTAFNFNSLSPVICDLTQMFGSTVADYIYSLEQATAGAGVAWFKNLFPHDYYPYNTGETTCVSAVNGDPYESYPLTLPSTVYGGTLTYDGDGVWTVKSSYKYVDMGDLEWTVSATNRFSGGLPEYAAPTGSYNVAVPCACSVYATKTQNQVWANQQGISIQPITGGYVYVYDSAYTDAAAFAASVAGQQLVYSLATPITYTLTTEQVVNTLKGQNNFWADCGDISVEYRADIQLYMQKLIAAALNA